MAARERDVERLQQALAAAEASNRSKSALLATVSHEIRTPLNGMIGMAQMLLDSNLESEQRRNVETIAATSDTILAIVEDLLDFAKIEHGKIELRSTPFTLLHLLEEVVTLLSTAAAARGLQINLDYGSELPQTYMGDGNRIRQIVTNLVNNAVKFTDRGQIVVRVTGARSAGGAFEVSIAVCDTGIGIPAARLADIFNEFVQLDAPGGRKELGTGLGLAISQRLARLMKGTISVTSEVAMGTTFTLTLPLTENQSDAAVDFALPSFQGQRVLVVDGNEVSRSILVRWLKRCRLEVVGVSGADAAVESVRVALRDRQPFDIVAIDAGVADGAHPSLAQDLAGLAECAAAKFLILLPGGSTGGAHLAAEPGHVAIIRKPLRIAHLSQGLSGLLQPVDAATVVPLQAVVAIATLAPRAKPIRILIAEDSRPNQLVLKSLLKREPVELLFAMDGLEIVDLFPKVVPDLILMDLSMPGLHGFDATREVRRIERELGRARTPIVALTANAMRGDREICIEKGMDDYLSKPILKKSIIKVIERWADGFAAGQARTPEPNVATERRLPEKSAGSPVDRRLERVAGV